MNRDRQNQGDDGDDGKKRLSARISYERIGPMILFLLILLSSFSGSSFIVLFMEPIIRVLSFVATGTYTAVF